ncbi:ATP-binding protein [Roseovarius sp.]|uniref:ATP-binding protein n=1 Tax=Roseovarius sp. TaxID=1486281 RepID=UPI0035683FF6
MTGVGMPDRRLDQHTPVQPRADPFDHAVTHFKANRDNLTDQIIAIAKARGYARYTTTIRAAWIEAIDAVTGCLANNFGHATAPLDAETDYMHDRQFAGLRAVARRHCALGVTFQMYMGLFKHFRDVYLTAIESMDVPPDHRQILRERLVWFFDAAELSIGADWAEASEDVRLEEMQTRVRSLALEKDQYFSVFESMKDAAFLLDRQFTLVNANQAAAELFSGAADAGEIVYLRAMRGRMTTLQTVLESALAAARTDEAALWLDTTRGPRCFDIRERTIHDALENLTLGHVVMLHDITAHRRATEVAQRARHAMSNFMATMSHEIRTPLHGVLGAAELLRDARQDQRLIYLDAIESTGRALLRTLSNVLNYSSNEAHLPAAQTRPHDLRATLDDYARVATIWGGARAVSVDLHVAANLPAWASLDWSMIQQVLTNLVSNAIRHDTGAGVSIRARRAFRRGAEGTWLRFEVANHGSGLSDDRVETLFQPFGQRLTTRQHASGDSSGAGLGLAISRRLIEALDGRIGFRNRAGGIVFWFEVPYRRAAPVAQAPEPIVRPVTPTKPALRCLLVEDDRIGRLVTADHVRRGGAHVTEAGTGAAALRLAGDASFDLCIVDYHLPDMNGAHLATRLRALCPEARLVALTANVEKIAELGCAAGEQTVPTFDAFLSKPASGAALRNVLNNLRNHKCATQYANEPQPEVHSDSPEETVWHAANHIPAATRRAMAAEFDRLWPARIADLRRHLAQGDAGQIAGSAHLLAGSCAVMGLNEHARSLMTLELACRSEGPSPDFGHWTRYVDQVLAKVWENATGRHEGPP